MEVEAEIEAIYDDDVFDEECSSDSGSGSDDASVFKSFQIFKFY